MTPVGADAVTTLGVAIADGKVVEVSNLAEAREAARGAHAVVKDAAGTVKAAGSAVKDVAASAPAAVAHAAAASVASTAASPITSAAVAHAVVVPVPVATPVAPKSGKPPLV